MFRMLILAVAALGISRFVWGIRQGYTGRPIQHPGDEKRSNQHPPNDFTK